MTLRPDNILNVLVEASVRAAFVIAVVGMALAVLRARAGSLRHGAWTAVVIAMLAAPFVPHWLPALPVTLPRAETVLAPPSPAAMTSISTPSAAAPVAPRPLVVAPKADATSEPIALPGPTPAPVVAPIPWLSIALVVWLAGVALLLVRLVVGWRYATRLVASSRALGGNLFESDLIATPLGVGVFRPRIIVPATWTAWPDDLRRAVLLHEGAHIRRRDALISLLASIGRCIHWFNPLVWWLECRIAVTAEQACDDEVIRTMREPDRYADLLVRMADRVRQHGGRVAWQGVGMTGGGAIGKRIDRVLGGAAAIPPTPTHARIVFATAAVVIAVGIGCRSGQGTGPVLPERSDAELQRQLQREKGSAEFYSTAQHLTPSQVAELERAVVKDPDDLDATRQLLIFYLRTGESVMGRDAMIAARRPHLLRMIERHPESDLAFWPLPKSQDPVGWDKAKALWLAHAAKPDVTARRLSYAARFFAISEKDVAERMLLQAQRISEATKQKIASGALPKGPKNAANTAFPQPNDLGKLYARAIVGADNGAETGGIQSVSLDEANGGFAHLARAKLAGSTDARLLFAAGEYLMFLASGNPDGTIGDRRIALGFDPHTIGESYRARAVAIDPTMAGRSSHWPPYQNLAPDGQAGYDALVKTYGERWPDATIERVALLPEHDQLGVLPALASRALGSAETAAHYQHDPAQAARQIERARYFANWALELAAKFKGDRRHAVTIFEAHLTRGLIALWDEDRALALKHLTVEGLLPDSVRGDTVYTMLRLTNNLLQAGERESVATFYEKVSRFYGADGKMTLAAAEKIRSGQMPRSYQTALLLR